MVIQSAIFLIINFTYIAYSITYCINMIKKHEKINIKVVSFGIYILVFSIIPVLAFFGFSTKITEEHVVANDFLLIQAIIIMTTTPLFLIKYRNKNKVLDVSHKVTSNHRIDVIVLLAYFSLILGLVSFFYDIHLFGGIKKYFLNIDYIRSFASNELKDGTVNKLLFLRMLKPFLTVSFFLFLYSSKKTNKIYLKIMVFFSGVISFIGVFFGGGRMVIFIFAFAVFSKKLFTRGGVIISVLMGLILLIYLDNFFLNINYGVTKEVGNFITTIIDEFSFPARNFIFNLKNVPDKRYFIDLFNWPKELVPSFILNIFGTSKDIQLYEINTVRMLGTISGGGMPTDIITFGFYQFGYLGIYVTIFIYTYIIKKIDDVLLFQDGLFEISVYVTLTISFAVMYFDLGNFFRNSYDIVILILFLNYIKKPSKRSVVVT